MLRGIALSPPVALIGQYFGDKRTVAFRLVLMAMRGFFAGLKAKGHAVEVMERVRQVGPNKEGARGSYKVYRIAG